MSSTSRDGATDENDGLQLNPGSGSNEETSLGRLTSPRIRRRRSRTTLIATVRSDWVWRISARCSCPWTCRTVRIGAAPSACSITAVMCGQAYPTRSNARSDPRTVRRPQQEREAVLRGDQEASLDRRGSEPGRRTAGSLISPEETLLHPDSIGAVMIDRRKSN